MSMPACLLCLCVCVYVCARVCRHICRIKAVYVCICFCVYGFNRALAIFVGGVGLLEWVSSLGGVHGVYTNRTLLDSSHFIGELSKTRLWRETLRRFYGSLYRLCCEVSCFWLALSDSM